MSKQEDCFTGEQLERIYKVVEFNVRRVMDRLELLEKHLGLKYVEEYRKGYEKLPKGD